MPITKQAIKRDRQNNVRREQNLRTMSAWQKLFKKLRKALLDGSTKIAEETLPGLYKALDTAAKKNVVSPNKAARKKSQAARMLKDAGGKMVKVAKEKKAPEKKVAGTTKKTSTKKTAPAKAPVAKKTPAKKKAAK